MGMKRESVNTWHQKMATIYLGRRYFLPYITLQKMLRLLHFLLTISQVIFQTLTANH